MPKIVNQVQLFQENGNQHVHEHSEFIWFLTDIALDDVGSHSLIYSLKNTHYGHFL